MPRNTYHNTPVVEFHEAFNHPVAWAPGVPDPARRKLRVALLLEEVLEFAEASGVELTCYPEVCKDAPLKEPNLVLAADGLADIRVVTDGAALEWGIPLEWCLVEVHHSNMSKLGEDGRPIFRGGREDPEGPGLQPARSSNASSALSRNISPP